MAFPNNGKSNDDIYYSGSQQNYDYYNDSLWDYSQTKICEQTDTLQPNTNNGYIQGVQNQIASDQLQFPSSNIGSPYPTTNTPVKYQNAYLVDTSASITAASYPYLATSGSVENCPFQVESSTSNVASKCSFPCGNDTSNAAVNYLFQTDSGTPNAASTNAYPLGNDNSTTSVRYPFQTDIGTPSAVPTYSLGIGTSNAADKYPFQTDSGTPNAAAPSSYPLGIDTSNAPVKYPFLTGKNVMETVPTCSYPLIGTSTTSAATYPFSAGKSTSNAVATSSYSHGNNTSPVKYSFSTSKSVSDTAPTGSYPPRSSTSSVTDKYPFQTDSVSPNVAATSSYPLGIVNSTESVTYPFSAGKTTSNAVPTCSYPLSISTSNAADKYSSFQSDSATATSAYPLGNDTSNATVKYPFSTGKSVADIVPTCSYPLIGTSTTSTATYPFSAGKSTSNVAATSSYPLGNNTSNEPVSYPFSAGKTTSNAVPTCSYPLSISTSNAADKYSFHSDSATLNATATKAYPLGIDTSNASVKYPFSTGKSVADIVPTCSYPLIGTSTTSAAIYPFSAGKSTSNAVATSSYPLGNVNSNVPGKYPFSNCQNASDTIATTLYPVGNGTSNAVANCAYPIKNGTSNTTGKSYQVANGALGTSSGVGVCPYTSGSIFVGELKESVTTSVFYQEKSIVKYKSDETTRDRDSNRRSCSRNRDRELRYRGRSRERYHRNLDYRDKKVRERKSSRSENDRRRRERSRSRRRSRSKERRRDRSRSEGDSRNRRSPRYRGRSPERDDYRHRRYDARFRRSRSHSHNRSSRRSRSYERHSSSYNSRRNYRSRKSPSYSPSRSRGRRFRDPRRSSQHSSTREYRNSKYEERNQTENKDETENDVNREIKWTRSSPAELYYKLDNDVMIGTQKTIEMNIKFKSVLLDRASIVNSQKIPYQPPLRRKPHLHKCTPGSGSNCSSEDTSEDEEDFSMKELDRKRKHPDRLHQELWFNDPGEMNDGPLCRCSAKAKRSGIRHGIYAGEDHLSPCNPNSNNRNKLYHYRITISPPTNFLIKLPTVIVHDEHDFIFEGFSMFAHAPLGVLPTCKVIRFNIEYSILYVEEPAPTNYTVEQLDYFSKYLFTELLELVDLDFKAAGDTDGCPRFHFMPRFVRELADNGIEILSMDQVLNFLLKQDLPLILDEELKKLLALPQSEWQNFADIVKGMIVTKPGAKPCSLRVDQIDREQQSTSVFTYPVIVHFGIKPPQLSYAGNPEYQREWREYVKLRHLVANMPKPTSEDKRKLATKELNLQNLRTKNQMKRDVTVSVSAQGFRRTGIMCDIVQHAMLIPVLVCHLRFHQSLNKLESTIQYQFKNRYLLQLALTHPSYRENFGTNPDHARNSLSNCGIRQPVYGDRRIHYQNTRKRGINTLINIMSRMGEENETESKICHNERLEFLGDAVVEFITSIHLFYIFPHIEEGGLATYRAAIVQNQHLAVLAKTLKLEDYMLYAHGSDLCHNLELRHAMANCFEALMGALFLDGGIDTADKVFALTFMGDNEQLFNVWTKLPPHRLQSDSPDGDRDWIERYPVLQELVKFEEQTGITFKHIRLLARAFTDRSIGYTNLTLGSNQRLEFLGDTVLQLIASEHLYKHFPEHHEGHLSLLRSSLVNNRTQAVVCNDLGMTTFAMYANPKADLKTKDRADLLEAFLGALYVDKGMGYCEEFCNVCFFPRLQDFIMNQDWNDPKSKLQQCCLTLRTMNGGEPDIPMYKVVACNGPTNTRVYEVVVYFRDTRLAIATGRSIQQAEMNAAKKALEQSASLFPQLHHQQRVIAKSIKNKGGNNNTNSNLSIKFEKCNDESTSDISRLPKQYLPYSTPPRESIDEPSTSANSPNQMDRSTNNDLIQISDDSSSDTAVRKTRRYFNLSDDDDDQEDYVVQYTDLQTMTTTTKTYTVDKQNNVSNIVVDKSNENGVEEFPQGKTNNENNDEDNDDDDDDDDSDVESVAYVYPDIVLSSDSE